MLSRAAGWIIGGLGAAVLALGSAASAMAVTYAPVDHPGPALSVPADQLAAALSCDTPPRTATRDVVLMIPGTTVDPDQAFAWNYEAALRAQNIPYCTITVPNHTDGDIQVAAEYVVNAVRAIRAASGRQVALFGWSQGASTLPRWALRFWPDIRPMVASLVGLAPLNNTGSVVGNAPCASGSCIPAAWQQAIGSHFMAALNSIQQTFLGIAYTVIYTRFDDVVTPDPTGALSVLPPGPNVLNVALQDICPTDTSDHLGIVASPAGYAAAIDALQHPGQVADLSRIVRPTPCIAGAMPYVTPASFAAGEAGVVTPIPQRLQDGVVFAEPPLRCYVTASCPTVPVSAGGLGSAGSGTSLPAAAGGRGRGFGRACAPLLAFSLHALPGRRIVRATVRMAGRRLRVLRGTALKILQLRRPGRASFAVTITTVDNRGVRRATRRHYRGCGKTRPRNLRVHR